MLILIVYNFLDYLASCIMREYRHRCGGGRLHVYNAQVLVLLGGELQR
jgi:hypothetical protein